MESLKRYWWGCGLMVVLIPFLPMTPNASFDGDWYIHLWFSRYYASFIKEHHHLPLAVNTLQAIGLPTNLFYGYILNPIFGLSTIILGPQLAARALIVFSHLLEFTLVFKLFFEITRNRFTAVSIATIVVWAIYPYTVVFSEAAIPEFFATTMVACGFCAWFLFLFKKQIFEKIQYIVGVGIFLSLAMGTHPITAFYSTVFFVIVMAVSLILRVTRKSEHLRSTLVLTLVLGIYLLFFLAPWIYVNLEFLKELNISKNLGMIFYFQDADSWWTRFQLIPFDKRSLLKGQMVNTSYLDTQINMSLLIFIVGYIFLASVKLKTLFRRPLFISGIILFVLTSWMSLSRVPFNFLPEIFKIAQFGWRLITYQNLSLLLILVEVFLEKPFAPAIRVLLACCLTMSFMATLDRLTHTMGTRNPIPRVGYSISSPIDSSFISILKEYNYADYLTTNSAELSASELVSEVNLDVGSTTSFGKVLPKVFQAKKAGWYLTNIVSFKWNEIELDGVITDSSNIRRVGNFLAVKLAAGVHQIHTRFVVPSGLLYLREISLLSFLLLIFLFLGFYFFKILNNTILIRKSQIWKKW